ncbi:15933_t:CDS:2, partial [Dentiscutata heterogama]
NEKPYQENWLSLLIAKTEEISFLSLTINSEKQFEVEVFEAIYKKELQNLLGYLEAYIHSYFYTYKDELKFEIINNTMDLIEWKRKGYENNCVEWFKNINYDCEKYSIKYLFLYSDIEQYNKEYLAY